MSKEPLWTDAKIKALTVLAANTVDPQARWMHEQIAMDMRNDYERALAFRNEDIGRLRNELKQAMARIAELEYQMSLKWPGVWQPVEDLTPEMVVCDLPEDCAICRKVQPAA